MAVSLLNGSLTNECLGSKTDIEPVGRRRVFVQTETGRVFGIELERGDNAHTVKRRLQLALNVPAEESSLTFGDVVLKNDLSVVRKDSPLLLTRNNLIHRSSSTPCLSPGPGGEDLQRHCWSGPVEIVGCSIHCSRTKQLAKEIARAIRSDAEPSPVHGGLGGAYYFRNCKGERVAIVKPTDEEPFAPNNPKGFVGKALGQPGLKRSVRVGETGFREVAAYLLDHEHFANVPPTILVKITHSIFNVNEVNGCSYRSSDTKPSEMSKIASLQQFIPHDFDASDHGTSSFPVSAVHRIGILDVRIFNTDRHGGNLLLRKTKLHGDVAVFGGQMELIPIDHGLCLPESLEDPYFEWIHWPQASIPFSEDELEYIDKLDPVRDTSMLRSKLPMIRESCLRVLVLCTIFLKEAAKHGLCLAEIGEMMSRQFKGMEEEPSKLETICLEARRSSFERGEESSGDDYEEPEEFQFDIDCDDVIRKEVFPPYSGLSIGRNPPGNLDECVEEDEEEHKNAVLPLCSFHLPPQTVSKLSTSLNVVGISERSSRRVQSSRLRGTYPSKSRCSKGGSDSGSGGFQGGCSRSANVLVPSSATFVTVADMGEEDWTSFIEKFHELLPDAFEQHKCGATSLRQTQRLGTSCQF